MILNIIKNSFLNIWPSLVIVCVTLISIRFAYLKTHKERLHFYEEFWGLLAIVYMLLLYELVTRVDYNTVAGFNIVPFREILRYDFSSNLFYLNVVGNIVLFIPFGYMVASYIKPKKIWTNTIIAILVSGTIEFVQYHIGRSFDIDDIILNTVGCIIGFLIYVAFKAIGRHLPDFLKSDWFKNLICIIIAICILIYILKIMGVNVGI